MARHPKPLAASAFLVLVTVAALLAPSGANAQRATGADAETLAEARRIFGEGLAHSDRHQWHEAVAAFRQVIELRSAPPVLYNLAIALIEIRQYPEAQDLLTRVLASEETSAEIRTASGALLSDLEEQAGRVELVFHGDPTGVIFFIDDFALGASALQHPHFVAPGAREIVARRGSTVLARAEPAVVRGETVRVELAPPGVPVTNAIHAEAEPFGSERETERSLAKNPWLWTGVGVGVAVVVTVVLAVTLGGGTGEPFEGDFNPGTITW
ncbi:MAG: tetratricopeptide repeat protein [Polyangiaceae bacterium]|nr:tetratricopeptide repeat protein [Polyangiaceae bacterium]